MITLQFVLGADLASRAIAFWGQGYGGFSHVDAVLSDGTLLGARNDVAGDQPAGVRIRPANYETWARKERLELACTFTQEATWEAWLKSQVGLPYDSGAIWDFVLGRSDLAKPGHWICSALQTGALEKAGLLPTGFQSGIASSQIAPNSLRIAFLALGGVST